MGDTLDFPAKLLLETGAVAVPLFACCHGYRAVYIDSRLCFYLLIAGCDRQVCSFNWSSSNPIRRSGFPEGKSQMVLLSQAVIRSTNSLVLRFLNEFCAYILQLTDSNFVFCVIQSGSPHNNPPLLTYAWPAHDTSPGTKKQDISNQAALQQ